MSKQLPNYFLENILEVIRDLPFWVLQALFVEIKVLLKDNCNIAKLSDLDRTDMIQLYTPIISELGQMVIQRGAQKKLPENFDLDLVNFLISVSQSKNIIDICIANKWTLEQCAKLAYICITRNYVQYNLTPALHNIIMFIAGEIRIGEFLIRKNKISNTQLEHALQVQKNMASTFGDRVKIVEVLINMGQVKEEEVSEYLILKDLSRNYINIKPPSNPQMVKLDSLYKDMKNNFDELITNYRKLTEEKLKADKKVEEIKDQLQLQIERNNMLQKKLTEAEKRFDLFKKL